MSINYAGLFNLLRRKKISLSKMSQTLGFSSATRAKFSQGEYVSLKTLALICEYLDATLDEIVKFESKQPPFYLYTRLKEEMEHKIKGGIYHETQILLTYNSNHIEGSRLSYEQTRYIYETNTIGSDMSTTINVDDIIETSNHFRCIDDMIKTALEPLNEQLIKDLHKLLKTGTSDANLSWFALGDYKKNPNTVGGNDTVQPDQVANEMATLIDKYEQKKQHSFEDIIEFHYEFEAIHPFQDGNGRVGRLIALKECLRHGHIPFTVDEDVKLFYYRGLKHWPLQRGFLIDTCLTGQDKYRDLLHKLNIAPPENQEVK